MLETHVGHKTVKAQHLLHGKAIAHPSRSSPTSISYQQGSSNHHEKTVCISAWYYDIVVSLLFILGTLAQVEARPKHVENSPRMSKDILLLGHLLRRPTRASKLALHLAQPLARAPLERHPLA
jgi:hypothetical protein